MKTTIRNRDGNSVSVSVEGPVAPGKLAFVLHGLGGNKDQPHIKAMVNAFLAMGYTVVSWDAVHTFGESSGGLYEDATVTNYYADLEDVIKWASMQPWYAEPFALCGHSLGGISAALFAQKYPSKVRALAPISTVVSGQLSAQIKGNNLSAWKRDGVQVSLSHDGKREKRLKWSHMEDRLQYDLLPNVSALIMPVILVVGELDDVTPPEHQQILFDKLPGSKELHVIKGAPHSFYDPEEQAEVQQILQNWLARL